MHPLHASAADLRDRLYPLQGRVQHYAWGGYRYIPALLGIDNTENKPCAELWMGAHPGAPSLLSGMTPPVDLLQWIERHPLEMLGQASIDRFGGRLPYLFKVLDARDMLSIQVHPSKEQAEAGFDAEERLGIPRNDPKRTYKDDNHKPELHVALTEFWMLHGFRPLEEAADTFSAVPELEPLAPNLRLYLEDVGDDPQHRRELLRALYGHIMTMPQREMDRLLDGLLARIEPLFDRGVLNKYSPHYWAVKAARTFPQPDGGRDRGILSIYLMNLLRLKPGQATFQAAGVPHAYLEGVNVELMANSDNVLRGGLTPKHVDVAALLKTIDFSSGPAAILQGEAISETERIYAAPAADFSLSCIRIAANKTHVQSSAHGADCLLTLQGEVILANSAGQRSLRRGDIVFIPAETAYTLGAVIKSVLYRATVPLQTIL